MIDNVPLQRISNLSKCLNMPFNEKSMEEFSKNYGFHKLTYKKQFNMLTSEGKETIYAHLLHNFTHGADAGQP